MLTIIEGLDGTGKSALASRIAVGRRGVAPLRLSEIKDYMALKDVGLPVNDWKEDIVVLQTWAHFGFDAILDRSIISAVVYDSDTPIEAWSWAVSLMSTHRIEIRVVFLNANNQDIAERDPEWRGKEFTLKWLRNRFIVAHNQLLAEHVPVVVIGTSGKTLDQVYQEFVAADWK